MLVPFGLVTDFSVSLAMDQNLTAIQVERKVQRTQVKCISEEIPIFSAAQMSGPALLVNPVKVTFDRLPQAIHISQPSALASAATEGYYDDL